MNQLGTAKSSKNGKKVVFWILSILFVSAILVGAYYFSNRSIELKSSFITNVTPHSATVVWRTERPTIGTVVVQKANSSEVESISPSSVYSNLLSGEHVYWDTRDLVEKEDGEYERGTAEAYYTHHVTATGLESDETYAFAVLNNYVGSDIINMANIKTSQEDDSIREPSPVYGMIEAGDSVNLQDAVIISNIVEANNPDVDRERSQYISTVVVDGTYVFDVGNIKTATLDEIFPALLDDEQKYTISMQILTPDGFAQHEITNGNFQPVDSVTIKKEEIEQELSLFDSLVSPVYAGCPSKCVGDCQGCNLPSDSDPKCATYGCGYMSHCCSGDADNDGDNDDSCQGHCSNGIKDCGENEKDCGGGGCATCNNGDYIKEGRDCEGQCRVYGGTECIGKNPKTGDCGCARGDCGGDYCPPCSTGGSHCFNRKQDEGEEGVDCGGDCSASCSVSGGQLAPSGGNINKACENEGLVFTCNDRPDWNCWCFNGRVAVYHRKGSNIYAESQSQAAAAAAGQTSVVVQEKYSRSSAADTYGVNSKYGIHTGEHNPLDPNSVAGIQEAGYYMKLLGYTNEVGYTINEFNSLPDGVIPMVRFCWDGHEEDCPFKDPNEAISAIQQLSAGVNRPVAIISGPNEALQEPWTLPGGCQNDNCAGQEE